MKVNILQENLNLAVNVVSRAITQRAQLPILANILIEASPGTIKLSATNLEIGLSSWQKAKVDQPGRITLPAKILSEVVATLPPGSVSLTLDRDRVKLEGGTFKAAVNGVAADEFPAIPTLKKGKAGQSISLKKDLLKEAAEAVAAAAGTDESRPIFTGVKLEICPTGMRLAATDGYRLGVKTVNEFDPGKIKKTLVVPARALLELARNLDPGEGELILAPTDEERQLIFSLPELELVTRLLEGEFPDFDKIIPKTTAGKAEMDAADLRQAVRAAAVFARDSANIIKFSLSKTGLLISANSPQVGENEVGVEAKYSGEKAEIAFNSRYLLEMLATIKAKTISLEVSGPLAPGLFKIPGDDSWLHIIMPVRVQG